MPNILLTRIDNRLVHGQVGVTWTKTIGANLLVVADDETAQDELTQRLMAVTAKSSGVGIRFFSIEKTAAIIDKAAPSQKIFIICKTPKDVRRLVDAGVEIKEVKDPDENFESSKEVTVIYKLMTDGHVPDLIQNERLLEAGKDYAVISITGNNMFYINQRLLEHSSACTVLEPEQFKKAFVEQLKEMREEYDND